MVWKAVVGYEGLYEVSDRGEVRSLDRWVPNRHGTRSWRRGAIMRQVLLNKSGYPAVGLSKDGVQSLVKVHVLVAEAFIGPRPEGYVTRHLDGDPTNNRKSNIRWGTWQENSDDRTRHGRVPFGEACKMSKLTATKVRRIRRMLVVHTNAFIAAKTGMSNQQISNIKLGKSWAHLE